MKRSLAVFTTIMLLGVFVSYLGRGITQQYMLHALEQKILGASSPYVNQITTKDVLKAKTSENPDAPVQRKLTSIFDGLSGENKFISQAYIFGTELEGGTGTSTIALSSRVLNLFEKTGLKLGDVYHQPQSISNEIKEVKTSNSTIFSQLYKDDWGTWVTVLYPVATDGEVFAYIGVDAHAGAAVFIPLLIAIGLLVVSALVAMVAARYTGKKRTNGASREEEEEASEEFAQEESVPTPVVMPAAAVISFTTSPSKFGESPNVVGLSSRTRRKNNYNIDLVHLDCAA